MSTTTPNINSVITAMTKDVQTVINNSTTAACAVGYQPQLPQANGKIVVLQLENCIKQKAQGYQRFDFTYNVMCYADSYVVSMETADTIIEMMERNVFTNDGTPNSVNNISPFHPSVTSVNNYYTDQDQFVTQLSLELSYIWSPTWDSGDSQYQYLNVVTDTSDE